MGMTLDEKCYLYGSCKCQTAGCVVRPDNGCPVYRYFKDIIVKDYENRLKTDMVAMLTEIQTEIEELNTPLAYQDEDYFLIGTNRCSELIQHKINTLKENRNDD